MSPVLEDILIHGHMVADPDAAERAPSAPLATMRSPSRRAPSRIRRNWHLTAGRTLRQALRRWLRPSAAMHALLLFAVACGDSSAPAPPPAPVAAIAVAPAPLVLEHGRTQQLTAVVRDPAGSVLTGRAVGWRSDDPTIATVSATGLVTAVGPGYATVVATSEGKTFSVAVTVPAPQASAYRLVLVDGSPMPRTLFTTVESGGDGATRVVRWDAHEGSLRLGDGGYEHRVGYRIISDGAPAVQGTFVSRGTFQYDALDGGVVFRPSDASPPFRGFVVEETLVLVRRLAPDQPERTFLHARP